MVFQQITKVFSSGCGSLLALWVAGHAGDTPVHDGASVGPGRTPWRVTLGLQSREICQVTTGSLSAQPEPRKTMANPPFIFFDPPSHAGTTFQKSF